MKHVRFPRFAGDDTVVVKPSTLTQAPMNGGPTAPTEVAPYVPEEPSTWKIAFRYAFVGLAALGIGYAVGVATSD